MKVNKNKILNLLSSEDSEIRQLITKYIRNNYNLNFEIYIKVVSAFCGKIKFKLYDVEPTDYNFYTTAKSVLNDFNRKYIPYLLEEIKSFVNLIIKHNG